jgi:hypothetical protein
MDYAFEINSFSGGGMIGKPPVICIACQNGYYAECYKPDEDGIACGYKEQVAITVERERGGQIKSPEDITDVQSTGRKRAAIMYPINEGDICGWAGLLSAGGGVNAIIGCVNNLATNIHHGPDKNTLNNKQENVHRICAYCHNYWHARNDEFYGERPVGTEPFIPLDGHEWNLPDMETKATEEQLVQEMITRSVRKDRRK